MASALENMRREVSEARSGMESAKVLIQSLHERLDQMLIDTESLQELQSEVNDLSVELSKSTDTLAEAVVQPGTGEQPKSDVVTKSTSILELDENGVPVGTGGPGVQPTESEGPVENGNVRPGPAPR